jgi:TrpR-related protein YerC/YecD
LTILLYFGKVFDMLVTTSKIWETETAQQLATALAAIDKRQDMQNFLRDVMTEKEITEISSRLEAARMLQAGDKYADIIAATGLSSRTVARISDWLQNGCNGYQTALNALDTHHSHILPVRAD